MSTEPTLTAAEKRRQAAAAKKEATRIANEEKARRAAEAKALADAEAAAEQASAQTETEETTEDESPETPPRGIDVDAPVSDEASFNPTPNPEKENMPVKSQVITLEAPLDKVNEVTYYEEADVDGFLKSKYNLLPDAYPDSLKRAINGANEYIRAMALPMPVGPQEGLQYQMGWYRTVITALSLPTSESVLVFDTLLYIANCHRESLFNERLASRFTQYINEATRDQFETIQAFIVNVCNPRQRSVYLSRRMNLGMYERIFRGKGPVTENLTAFIAANG